MNTSKFQKWLLLIGLVIAAIIWIRNLKLLIPSRHAPLPNAEMTGGLVHVVLAKQSIEDTSFSESQNWHDPFLVPKPSQKSSEISVSQPRTHQRREVTPLEPPPWELSGIVWDDRSPTAILNSTVSDDRFVVTRGDSIGTSRVERISDTTIWLRDSGRRWTLTLKALP